MQDTTIIRIIFVFIIPLICIILFIRVLHLENILKKKKQAKEFYENKKQQSIHAHQLANAEICLNPSNFYSLKDSCMNANESLMYYYLNKALDGIIPDGSIRKNYFVFPQVPLYSLVKIRPEVGSLSRNIVQGNYIAKSIDFVICHCHKVGKHYKYTPVLLIELDGPSHYSPAQYGAPSFERQQANDAFKNDLFKSLNLKLCRFSIVNKPLSRPDLPEVYRMLRENLPILS